MRKRRVPRSSAFQGCGSSSTGFSLWIFVDASKIKTHRLKPALFVLDELAQAAKGVVPLLRDDVEVAAGGPEPPPLQSPDTLASVARAAYKARRLHHAQVLGDGLTSDSRARRQPCDGQRPLIAEAGDQSQANFISQRRKDWRGVQLRHRRRTTPPEQGISRGASPRWPSLGHSP